MPKYHRVLMLYGFRPLHIPSVERFCHTWSFLHVSAGKTASMHGTVSGNSLAQTDLGLPVSGVTVCMSSVGFVPVKIPNT